MRFVQFLSQNLDGERGRQTRLANDLRISKSTITAWRNGAKPDFISCLLLAEHFRVDPVRMFEMVQDKLYERVYLRFLAPERRDRLPPAPSEEDLYGDPQHARVHRELQQLLESDAEAASAIATMIRTAHGQVVPADEKDGGANSAEHGPPAPEPAAPSPIDQGRGYRDGHPPRKPGED